MKIRITIGFFYQQKRLLKIIMRTFIFMLCVSVFGFSPKTGSSQNAIITIIEDQTISVEGIFNLIKIQTDYQFVYNHELVKNAPSIDIKKGVVKSGDLLKQGLDPVFLTYEFINNTVVVKPKIHPDFKVPLQDTFTITGKVTDAYGVPVSGATVVVSSSAPGATVPPTNFIVKGTTTDFDGSYTIEGTIGHYLAVYLMGYESQNLQLTTKITSHNFTLKEDLSELEEVLVVGYGTAKRKDITGSVSSVETKDIQKAPVASIDNALVGKASGVQIIKADGSPGGAVRIKIRGGTSLLGGNDPLYVIDGVPVVINNQDNLIPDGVDIVSAIEGQSGGEEGFNNTVQGAFARGLNNLAGLNINDIASIDILKDASATAIYGSRAANGVVVITTKSGSYNTKTAIDLSVTTSISNPFTQDVMNAQQFREFYTASAQNLQNLLDGGQNPFLNPNGNASFVLNDPDGFFGTGDTDWLDLVTRNAVTTKLDLSVSGGSDKVKYYTSLGYTDQEGTIINTGFKRISSVSKLEAKFSDRLKVSTRIGLGFTDTDLTNGVYQQALLARPDFDPFNEDGTTTDVDPNVGFNFQGTQNPLATAQIRNEASNFNLNAYLSLQYKILEDLTFTSTFSVDQLKYRQSRFVPSFVTVSAGTFGNFGATPEARGSESDRESLRSILENYLTWNKTFNENNSLNLTAGSSFENFDTEFFSVNAAGYPDDFVLTNISSAQTITGGSGAKGGNSLTSFYTRANYNHKDKYLFTFTGRADGSSKFAPDNRWAIFPSGAIAWRISQENFLKESNTINELKLRASMGLVGTQNIADNLYRTLYNPSSYAGSSATIPAILGNSDLKWEETLQKDIALDFALFNNRVSGTVGYYNKETDGQLLNISVAPSSGFGSLVTNIATIENKGLEIDLNVDIIRSKDFSWNANLNLANNKSKVTNINGGPFSDPFERENLNLGNSIVQEGEPLGLLYGFVTDGIIQNQAELDTYVAEATAAWGFFPFIYTDVTIGSVKYLVDPDANNGRGNFKRDIIGNANPDVFGGFSNTFTYKNFSLYTLFNFSFGNELIWQRDVLNRQPNGTSITNFGVEALNYFPNASDRQIPIYGSTGRLSDLNVYDASFVRLKQLTLNYQFSGKLLEKMRLRNASLFLSASNLFTITDYPGLDPEVSDDPASIIGGGRDTDNFPNSKTVSLGIRVGF